MKDRPRRSLAPLLVVAAIALAFAVYFILTGQPKSIDMPADDAPPEQVVNAYMQASTPTTVTLPRR